MATNPAPYHVLLIEEDPRQTDLYADLIREVARCKVDVMSRVENSFAWIARSNYHLVVIDASGKDLQSGSGGGSVTGLTLLEQIKRMSPVTSVILLSDQANVEQAVAAIRLGAEDYFKKPLNLESFQLAVKRGLDRKTIFGENTGASSFLNLLNSCQMISASLEQRKIIQIVQSYLLRELKCQNSAVYCIKDSEPTRADEFQGGSTDRAMEEILDIALHASNPLAKMIEANEYYRFVERGQLTPGLFIFRFRCAAATDYFCVCLSPERPTMLEAFESRLRMLKAQIEVTGRNIDQYMGVQHLAYVDDATGLYNTRYLNYILDREITQARTTSRSFAVLFIDADKFKGINDNHGHMIGTKILNELGNHLKKFVRDSDTVFRYGGDEFVAVLSSCDLETARTVADRIRHSVEHHCFLNEEGLQLRFTVSIGVALFPDHANSKKAIIEAADHAMYHAKKTTRNNVFIASMPTTVESKVEEEAATAPEAPLSETPSLTEAPLKTAKVTPLKSVTKSGTKEGTGG
jgi:diguanylate cyclase (GGDEF)-like protein